MRKHIYTTVTLQRSRREKMCKFFLLAVALHQLLAWGSAKSLDSTLSFLVIGDWGGQEDCPYTTPAEVKLAKVMGKEAEAIGSQFTLGLGDNFYDGGVKDVQDARFKETFEVGRY